METPDFLVQDEVYHTPVFSLEEAHLAQQRSLQASKDDYGAVAASQVSQAILGMFDPSRLNIKVEQPYTESDGVDATDDESVAVEALRSLSGARLNDPKASQEYHPHHCPICKESFDKLFDYNNHLVAHASSRPHACRICGALFLQKMDLDRHLVSHEIPDGHLCKVCGQKFSRLSGLTNHMKIHTYTAGRAMMDRIGDTNELENILTGSVDADVNRQKLVLPSMNLNNLGGATWGMNYEPEYNLMSMQPNLNIPVNPANDKSDHSESGQGHQAEAQGQGQIDEQTIVQSPIDPKRPYRCDVCGKAFAREKAYINHVNNVNNHFACDRCEQQFPSEKTLAGHRRFCGGGPVGGGEPSGSGDVKPRIVFKQEPGENGVVKGFLYNGDVLVKEEKKFPCEVCGKSFNTKQKLFRHNWVHRKKMHMCEVCSLSFDDLKMLDEHRKDMHPASGPHDCAECGKSFVSRQGLWEHSRTHNKDIITYRCEECGKVFTSRQGYIIHNRKHSDERPYGCKFCMKSFRDGGTLRKHERIHTGERPHACPVCAKSFNQKVVLREHIRWLHANTAEPNAAGRYECIMCTMAFGEKDELSAHLMKHSDDLGQIARLASKNNIASVLGVTGAAATGPGRKRIKVETATLNVASLLSCDVQINESAMPLAEYAQQQPPQENNNPLLDEAGSRLVQQLQQNGVSVGVEKLVVEPTAYYDALTPMQAKIKVKDLTQQPPPLQMKVECDVDEAPDDDDDNDNTYEQEFECELCGVWFKAKQELDVHMQVHV